MNRDRIIRLTTFLSIVSIVLLIYWVFMFVSITVFGFRVFKENLSETFSLSILGILALLAGALIVNVILNLSKIAEAIAESKISSPPNNASRRFFVLFLATFPILFGLLALGDYASTKRKEAYLVGSAHSVVTQNAAEVEILARYSYTRDYWVTSQRILSALSKQDESFPNVSLIVQDKSEGKTLFLELSPYSGWSRSVYSDAPERTAFIYACSREEKAYLSGVFHGEYTTYRFSSSDGTYELYYPVRTKHGPIVLYFYQQSRYGKIGS